MLHAQMHQVTKHLNALGHEEHRKALGRLSQNVHKSLITKLVDRFGASDERPEQEPLVQPTPRPTPDEPQPTPETPEDTESPQQNKPVLKRSNASSWEEADLSALAVSDSDGAPCITNPRIWWRHPLLRLAAVWIILFTDFYIYGEDPVQDSHVNYLFFGVFEDMFITAWPKNKMTFKIIRIALCTFCLIFSLTFGRWVIHHKILRDFCGLQMFHGTQGVGVVNFLTFVVCFEYILPYPINYIESGTFDGPITEESVLKYYEWGKIWQSTAAIADVLSITMITDAVLQDRTVWPKWAPGLKWLWNDACGGWVRVLSPYFFLGVFCPLIIHGLWSHHGKSNGIYTVEEIMTAEFATTQWIRVLVAALLTMVDITTCLQDWEFPAYSSPADFKVVGTFMSDLDIPCFSNLFKRLFRCTCIPEEFWECLHFKMSGKWIAYLPAFGALGVDWWYMARTIFPYTPQKFAQYERPTDCVIFSITDEDFIARAYKAGELLEDFVDQVTYEARKGIESDVPIHAKFCDQPVWLKYVPFALGIGAGVAFVVLVFRAEYYWDKYTERVDQEQVKHNLQEHYEQSSQVVQRLSRTEE